MKVFICSPVNVGPVDGIGDYVVGLPTCLAGVAFKSCTYVTLMHRMPAALNLAVCEITLDAAALAALEANNECYVFSGFRLQQGDTRGFVRWLKNRGVKRGQFQSALAEFWFKPEHNNMKELGILAGAGLEP